MALILRFGTMSCVISQLRFYRKSSDVCTEPPLQPLSGETMTYATANVEDGARLDISDINLSRDVTRNSRNYTRCVERQ